MSGINSNFSIDFIGIGVHKCATTWIYECLKAHPEVCGSSEKEIHFFNEDSQYQQGLSFYKKYFEHCPKNCLKGEFSTHYLESKEAPKRIRKHFPETKIIVSLRDPVERAYSHYRWAKRMKMREGAYDNFKKALRKDDKIVRLSKYHKGMKRYLDLFSEHNIHVILYKNLKENPVQTIQQLYDFLGVDSTYKPKQAFQRKNTTGSLRKKATLPLLNRLVHRTTNKIKSYNLYRYLRNTPLHSLHKKLISWNKGDMKAKNTESPTRLKDINSEVKQEARAIFKEDIKKLESLIGKDLSHWK